MSKIEELEKELYVEAGKKKLEGRMRERTFFPKTLRKPSSSWFGRGASPPGATASLPKRSRLFIAFLVIAPFLVSIGGAVFLFLYLGTQGQEAEVIVRVRDTIESGEILTVPVVVKNITSSPLREVELVVVLPEGSLVRQGQKEVPAPSRLTNALDDLAPGEERVVEIVSRLFGQEGEERVVEATVLYRPEHLRARFSARGIATTRVVKVPVNLSWEFPETLSRGQDFEARLRYHSNARLPFAEMAVRIEYPPGFSLTAADPSPEVGTTIWDVGTIDPGGEGSILIRGKIVGEEGEIKAFRGSLGTFNTVTKEWRTHQESVRETRIAVTPLSVTLFLAGAREGVVAPGHDFRFLVRYRNNTTFVVRNLTVRAFLEGVSAVAPRFLGSEPISRSAAAENILDFATLRIGQGGVFEGSSRSLLWAPGGTPALSEVAPGEGGELEFEIRGRGRPLVRTASDKNFVVRAFARVDAAGIPPELAGTSLRSEDFLEFKASTIVSLESKAAHRSSPIANSGPLPPKVGKETTYAIVWGLRNFTNDVRNVTVRTLLPPNIMWKNVIFPKDARITHDAASGEVLWHIGEVKAGVGVASPALIGAFQVGFIPSPLEVRGAPTLVQESRLTGEDAFTEEKIEERAGVLTIKLSEDPLTESREWEVAP